MIEYLIVFALSAALALIITPKIIPKLESRGFVVRDYYKKGKVYVPTLGGFAIILSVITSLVVAVLVFRLINIWSTQHGLLLPRNMSPVEFAMLQVIIIYGFYGLVDDELNVGRFMKIIIPLVFSYPLVAALLAPPAIKLPLLPAIPLKEQLFSIPLWRFYKYVIIPVYIMVVANLVNMHSGFNGLQCGLSIILLLTLVAKSVMIGSVCDLLPLIAVLGAVIGFFYYNKYPSRIFEGNIGSFSIGATIGGAIIMKGFLVSGVVMLIPHVVNFLMYVYWRLKCWSLRAQGRPIGQYHSTIKFGTVREDGTILVANRLTLKWILPYHYKMKEWQVVLVLYSLTAVFCLVSVFIPY